MKQEHERELSMVLLKAGKVIESGPTEEQLSRAEAIMALIGSGEFLKAVVRRDTLGRNLLEFNLGEAVPGNKPSSIIEETIVLRVQRVREGKGERLIGELSGRMKVFQNFEDAEDDFVRQIPQNSEKARDWFNALYSVDGWGVDSIIKSEFSTYEAFLSRNYYAPEYLALRQGGMLERIWKKLQSLIK